MYFKFDLEEKRDVHVAHKKVIFYNSTISLYNDMWNKIKG